MQRRQQIWMSGVLVGILPGFFLVSPGLSAISGNCSNCHTMHNSQDNALMADLTGETGPNQYLTRGSCLGCHGQVAAGGKIVYLGDDQVPQVFHTDASGDLAGGNFAYLTGMKGSGGISSKGHNVIEFGIPDDELDLPPGQFHDHGIRAQTDQNFTCAGNNGCHGWRSSSFPGISSLAGAHHNNVDGALETADKVANSYRFLLGVKGLENPIDPWENKSSTSHNEYFGAATPMDGAGGCADCHSSMWIPPGVSISYVSPANQTISGFCGSCHGDFHLLPGIGGEVVSPFIRHPTDVVLPGDENKDYRNYTVYDVQAPVARQVVPASPASTVAHGPVGSVVMCISCHYAHAGDYPDLLRWDYSRMVAHNAGDAVGTGCFTCHTTKDD